MKGKIKDPKNNAAHVGKSTYATKVRENRQMYGIQRKSTGQSKGNPELGTKILKYGNNVE